MALRAAVEILQVHRLGGAVQACELADGIGGNRANGGCPFRRLLDAVFAFAHHIGTPLLKARGLDPLLDELVVDEVLFVEHLRNRQHHGKVGAGADGNPLVGENLGALRVARIDDDGLATVLVGELHVVRRRAEPRDDRVHAPHDEQLRIEDVGRLEARQRVGSTLRAARQIDAEVQHLAGGVTRRGVLSPRAEACFPPRSQREAVLFEAGILGMEDAVRAVLALDLLHLLGDGVKRLFPADLNEVTVAGALFANALHRMQKARFGVELLFPGMTHGTRTHLDVALPDVLPAAILAAVILVHGVIGLDREDLPFFDMAFEDACRIPAAVCRTGRVEDALSFASGTAGIDDGLFVHQPLLFVPLSFHCTGKQRICAGRRRRLAATQTLPVLHAASPFKRQRTALPCAMRLVCPPELRRCMSLTDSPKQFSAACVTRICMQKFFAALVRNPVTELR